MRSSENTLPSTLWAWIGVVLLVLNLIWTVSLLEASAVGIRCGMIVVCMIMTVSASSLIGIIVGLVIHAGVDTYDEERQCLLSRN